MFKFFLKDIYLKLILSASIILVSASLCSANQKDKSISQLLSELDHIVDNKEIYERDKEQQIDHYRSLAASSQTWQDRYNYYGRLFDEFRCFQSDSAYHYARLKADIAERNNDANLICDSKLNTCEILSIMGDYNEALQLLATINSQEVPSYLKSYFYHVNKTLYDLMSLYTSEKNISQKYVKQASIYRDSLITQLEPKSQAYCTVTCERLIANNKYKAAENALLSFYDTLTNEDHSMAFVAITLANVYNKLGNKDARKRFLIISSISDLKSGVKEYTSLQELSYVLFREGDIDRAYKYLKCSMADADYCNARLRTLEINNIFPIIDDAYKAKNKRQQRHLTFALICISILSVALVGIIYALRLQMKKRAAYRESLRKANEDLSSLNETLKQVNLDLKESNQKLKESNENLGETNYIKEEYIGRYMDQCSTYIEKMESYSKSLLKIVVTRNMDNIIKAVKSSSAIDNELKAFYHNFDETFLHLFPNFVTDFNNLLNDNEHIIPKNDNELTTELRIFALIRLGITDSVKIAQFLRYSVTTIYNYRTRTRNKAKGERNDFEEKVKILGTFHT